MIVHSVPSSVNFGRAFLWRTQISVQKNVCGVQIWCPSELATCSVGSTFIDTFFHLLVVFIESSLNIHRRLHQVFIGPLSSASLSLIVF